MASEEFERGLKVRREVLGADHVERSLATADEFTAALQTYVTEVAWGRVWARSVLSRKQISLNNICMLAALNRPHEFELHFRGAIRNGCSLEELRDTCLQIAVYCGAPAGVEAFRLGRKVFDELKNTKTP
ncbi:MAG: 4-carboxymuconolactone decarboxylase [Alphaproteobacteria bacterium]|nr:4-carboxymuconolactone decarboxylase [Alphaproteobacteria bacterium]